MSPVVSAEIVAGTLVLLALCALAQVYLRRRVIAAGSPLMLCAVRGHGAHQYRLGLLRFADSRLDWFTLLGFGVRPQRSWQRARLDIGAPSAPHDVLPGLPSAVEVECRYGTDTFSVALTPAAYTAVRSWAESAPPGYNVNVA
jgi:hypothetical protein